MNKPATVEETIVVRKKPTSAQTTQENVGRGQDEHGAGMGKAGDSSTWTRTRRKERRLRETTSEGGTSDGS